MADVEDKEKAEKLAAAKKRFEQLKKQQKKGKKGGKNKEEKAEDKPEEAAAKDDKDEAPAEPADETAEAEASTAPEPSAEAPESTPENTEEKTANDDEEPKSSTPSEGRPTHARKQSQSAQSRHRSESFRQGSISSPITLKSPSLPSISAEDEVQDIYRKQHSRIEELEKENKSLKSTQSEVEARLQKTEEELEQLREGSADVAELKSKAAAAEERAKEVEKLNAEVTSLQRQLTQAQQAVSEKRRKSNASPSQEIQEQLAQKTSTIESLELELSNLRNQYHISQATIETNQVTISDLEERAKTAEATAEAAKQEVETLKQALSKSAEDSKDKNAEEDPAALQQRITILESDLRTAQTSASEATQRATSLEQKTEALTKLHKDVTATSSTQEKEISDLKARITSLQTKKSPKPDDADESLSDLEDEEREKMVNRIRELEAENFELRRGVWREKRQALQPGLEDDGTATSPAYEDVDLNGSNPYAASGAANRAGVHGRQGSSFQDVLQSGISAFTGRDRRMSGHGEQRPPGRGRGQSLGLLSEDGFDEDAFREAQEEEGKRRLERIREVKRGLDQWRGWRVDLVDIRQGGLGGNAWTGPVFDV